MRLGVVKRPRMAYYYTSASGFGHLIFIIVHYFNGDRSLLDASVQKNGICRLPGRYRRDTRSKTGAQFEAGARLYPAGVRLDNLLADKKTEAQAAARDARG